MGLDSSYSVLVEGLRQICDPTHPNHAFPASRSEAIQRFTDAIVTAYSYKAEDISGDAVATLNEPGWLLALLSGLGPSWTAAAAAQGFGNAFAALWTGGAFAVGTPPAPGGECPNVGGTGIFSVENTSVVNSANGASVQADLLNCFNNLSSDGDAKMNEFATIIHNRSRSASSVSVLISGLDSTPPPGGPIPITNTCRVF